MVTIAVKKVAYRSVEVFFKVFFNVGESRLGIYRPPGGSEIIFLEQGADESIFRLFPARVDGHGQGNGVLPFPSARGHRFPLPLRTFHRPLGSGRVNDWGGRYSVLWYTEDLEGLRSTSRPQRDEGSDLPFVGVILHGFPWWVAVGTTTLFAVGKSFA